MPNDQFSLRDTAREGAVEARVRLGDTYLYATGPREVVDELTEALARATGKTLPPAEQGSSPVPEPLPGQTDIYDFVE